MELSISSLLLNISSTATATSLLILAKPSVHYRLSSVPLLPLILKQINNNNSQSTLSCSFIPQKQRLSCSKFPFNRLRSDRIGEVDRVTKETNVWVKINLDGTGVANSNTSIPFLDLMLDATGDIHIDDHHTNEDVALALGTALLQSLGDRKGINRFGDFSAPLDEAYMFHWYDIHCKDLSGRPHLSYGLNIPTSRVGTYDTQSLVNTSGMTLHIRQLAGKNSHHIIEATFKAFTRALRQATKYDPRHLGTIPRFDTLLF